MKKKKIAILTQPLGKNYGGIIQNYALQQVLKNIGHDPVTINRHKNKEYSDLKIFLYDLKMKKNRAFKNSNAFYQNLTSKERLQIYDNNFIFITKYLTITKKLDTNQKFYQFFTENKYDAIIVGSDQTWRPEYSPNIDNYFLDFYENYPQNKIIKIAYASSFGTAEWEFSNSQTQRAKILVKQFDAISVREDSGIHLCSEYLDVNAEETLDPTMLLTKEEYRKLYSNLHSEERSGIFTYVLDQSAEKKMIIKEISSKLKLDIFHNQPKSSSLISKKDIAEIAYPTLELWLKAFDDADFVITDSFHGTVFSILFNKPFIAIANINRGASRFTSLLKKLGLESRLIFGADELDDALIQDKIDYEKVNLKLEMLRNESLDFLNKNLS